MSKHQESFTIPLPFDVAVRICREAVAETGWSVTEQRPDGIRCKEAGHIMGTWPVTMDITYARSGESTLISLRGSIFYFGPIQSKHLKGQMGNLRNRIELTSTKRTERPPAPAVDLASQLRQLAELHRSGGLSDAEFQVAKEKLLG